jgi:BirA family biotin operon repressor/biotin-[acetyl-CoA-carboxylase] ligase
MADLLTPERVRPLLRGGLGDPYVYADRCESTQRLLGDDLPHGAVAVCNEQTAGRGRLGRSWQAPAGTALLCSMLLRQPPGRNVAELSLVAALATCETVENVAGRQARIKWPNDVLLEDDRKAAGILLEGRAGAVVLGIGLNINQTGAELPVRPRFPAGSLFLLDGIRRERAPILAELLFRIEHAYERWTAGGLAELLPELLRRDALRGRTVDIGELRGTAAGMAETGELVLETPQGRQLVASGEVVVG